MAAPGQDPRLAKQSRYTTDGRLRTPYQRALDDVRVGDDRGLKDTEWRRRLDAASVYDEDGELRDERVRRNTR